MSRLFVSILITAFWVITLTSAVDADESDEKDDWDIAEADLGPSETLRWTVNEGTWMCLDVSPDGEWIVFDLLGDLYRMPISGGKAERLRGGRAYDVQPRYSPDGEWIAFTSDAGGADNIWVMPAGGGEARAVTEEDFRLLNNPTWTPDSRFVVARKHFTSRRSMGAGEMWMYDVVCGGKGVQLTERPTDQKDVNEPLISPDGRYLYYSLDRTSGKVFQYNKDPNTAIYAIRRLDLETGEDIEILNRPGGSVRPQISPDGNTLAFVRRARLQSVLMLCDLESGEERPLFHGLSKDTQETWSVFGAYPGFAWTPDGKSLLVWAKGKIHRVDAATGDATVIPFEADLEVECTRALRFPHEIGGKELAVKVLQWPSISPDGSRIVFQALGYLWLGDMENGQPRRLTQGTDFEFHPTWSADGNHIVYTTWNDIEAGRVLSVPASGGTPSVLVGVPGHYAYPYLSPDGEVLVYQRVGRDGYRGALYTTETGVYIVSTTGGEPRLLTKKGSRPRFNAAGDRVLLFDSSNEKKTLFSVDLLGGDRRDLVTSERAAELVLSPDERWVGFVELWEVYVAPRPAAGGPIEVGPEMKNLPVRKISEVAGEFLSFSPDSRELRFGLGPELTRVEILPLFTNPEAEVERETVSLGWGAEADIPSTDVLLTGATILTMAEPAVIENGAVHVRGNRIVAVGAASKIRAEGAAVVDVTGRVLLPGYVDTHAHMWNANYDLTPQQLWSYLANLSFGVTTTHDPSNHTRRVFANSELVQSGAVLGPRIFSTGTVLYGAEGDFKAPTEGLDDAERHLKRLKAYGAFSAKSYNQPRRNQRQWFIRAARDLEMMVMPEGGSLYTHNMTMFMDGHTTLEHAVPLAELYDDALTLMSKTGTAYTPTLVVGYGGLWGESYWYQNTQVWEDERLLRFVPREVVDSRARRRTLAPEGEFHHFDLAKWAAEVVRRGGLATIGAHGQMQGLGVHWELWMYGQGGLEPLDALKVATLYGARAIGLDKHIGSIERGKLADLVVLDEDPREDLLNSASVELVMMNGRLFDARTLEQLEPERKPLPPGPVLDSIPASLVGHGCLHVGP